MTMSYKDDRTDKPNAKTGVSPSGGKGDVPLTRSPSTPANLAKGKGLNTATGNAHSSMTGAIVTGVIGK